MSDLGNSFYKYFQIVPATNPYLLEQVYKLRYEVLCLEKKFSSFIAADYPDRLEKDVYDERSSHYLVHHLESDRYIGTVRLIFGGGVDGLHTFPMIKYAHDAIDVSDFRKVATHQVAEISRLIIKKEFRSRIRSFKFTGGTYEDYKQITRANRLVTHPVIGLLAAILKMSSDNDIRYWIAGMEPSLNKRLSQLGLQLKPIGPYVQYHGLRRPYMGVVDDVVNSLFCNNREIWGFVTEQGKLWPPPDMGCIQPQQAG